MHDHPGLKFQPVEARKDAEATEVSLAIRQAALKLTLMNRVILETINPMGITASTDLGDGFVATLTVRKKCMVCNLPMGEGVCGHTKH